MSVAILLLAFSRPEFTERRIGEVLGSELGIPIYCSIDNFEGEKSELVSNQFSSLQEKYPEITWTRQKRRIGLAKHLYSQVSELLKVYESVVVIEDDVSVSHKAIQTLSTALETSKIENCCTFGLFGLFPESPITKGMANMWRRTKYFSAWGWGVRRELWEMYSLDLVTRIGRDKVYQTSHWRELTDLQKARWNSRFSKVEQHPEKTWDFQMQFLTWIEGFDNYLPLWRLCDNEGLGEPRATNTVDSRPRWIIGRKTDSNIGAEKVLQSNLVTKSLEFIDSYTWAGDRNLRDLRVRF